MWKRPIQREKSLLSLKYSAFACRKSSFWTHRLPFNLTAGNWSSKLPCCFSFTAMYRQLLSHPFRRYSSNSDPAKPQPYQPQQTRKPTSHETQQSGKASTGVGLGSINKYAVDMLSARRGLPSEAGRKASEKVVREGELPAKYRPAARKYVAPVLFANPKTYSFICF